VTLTTGSGEEPFDQVLVTTSPALMARMAPDLPESYLKGLLDLKSMGAVVLVVSLKHQLSREGYYWYNLPKTEGYPFLAMVEHTNFVSSEHFGGEHILYCGDYLELDHEYFKLSQEELVERFTPSFKSINPDYDPSWINQTWLFKTNYAQPIPLVNHSQKYSGDSDTPEGCVFRKHVASVSVGPRHQFCRGNCPKGCPANDPIPLDRSSTRTGGLRRFLASTAGGNLTVLTLKLGLKSAKLLKKA